MDTAQKPARWRVVVAFILDLIVSFFVIGFAVASVRGDTTENGFALSGLPAVTMIALWIACMAGMPRPGGRILQRVFGAI